MTTRADYTTEEWALLVDAPGMVGLGMLTGSRSGPVGKLREFLAFRACLSPRKAPEEVRRNELIMAILAEQPTWNSELTDPFSGRGDLTRLISALISARLFMLAHSEMVAGLLADKTPYDEAYEVKRWLMWIARRVAGASGDGWLGTGHKISDTEASLLDQLATSLRITRIVEALPPVELELEAPPSAQDQWSDGAVPGGPQADKPDANEPGGPEGAGSPFHRDTQH